MEHESESLMNLVNTAYVRQLRRTSNGQRLCKSEKLVLFLLAYCHNEDSGESWVSLEDLAADSLLTQDEVIGILQGLERKAVLQMIPDSDALRIGFAAARGSGGRASSRKDRRAIVGPGVIVAKTVG